MSKPLSGKEEKRLIWDPRGHERVMEIRVAMGDKTRVLLVYKRDA